MVRIVRPLRALLGACVFLLPLIAQAKTPSWDIWLISQIEQHPEIIAAQAQLQASVMSSNAMGKPLYNPEFSTSYESVGEDRNYQVGLSQTIDWWDEVGARKNKSIHANRAANIAYQEKVLNKTAEVLSALVHWDAAHQAAEIARDQQAQINALFKLIERRQKAGDLGSIDSELTFLSLSDQLGRVASIESNLEKSLSRIKELLPKWSLDNGSIPLQFWQHKPEILTDKDLVSHPSISYAQVRWKLLEADVEATRRAVKSSPTVGLSVGNDGGENLVGMSISVPINIRNNYSSEISAAENFALEAQASFNAILQKYSADYKATYESWIGYEKQYNLWIKLAKSRVKKSEVLLKRQWNSGDLSTNEYLIALNQRSDSLLSGIELKKQTQLEFIEVLKKSFDLMDALKGMQNSTN